jgi:hypothetical protein
VALKISKVNPDYASSRLKKTMEMATQLPLHPNIAQPKSETKPKPMSERVTDNLLENKKQNCDISTEYERAVCYLRKLQS